MYPAGMNFARAAIVVFALCLAISCSDSGTGGTGGTGGGGGTAGSTGTAGGGGGVNGSAGTTGTGGGPADCQACVVCANTNCANQVAACRANTGCNMIYQCAANCTSSIQTCVENNISGAQTFLSSVGPCISSNCAAQCMQ
jgi:hypothetical protein